MAKKPRKPKHIKYPKLPKKSASYETMQNYKRRCEDVDKRNREKTSEYNRKISEIGKAKTLYESLRRKKTRG